MKYARDVSALVAGPGRLHASVETTAQPYTGQTDRCDQGACLLANVQKCKVAFGPEGSRPRIGQFRGGFDIETLQTDLNSCQTVPLQMKSQPVLRDERTPFKLPQMQALFPGMVPYILPAPATYDPRGFSRSSK